MGFTLSLWVARSWPISLSCRVSSVDCGPSPELMSDQGCFFQHEAHAQAVEADACAMIVIFPRPFLLTLHLLH